MKTWRIDCMDNYFNFESNKIIIKMCTNHYLECLRERNEHHCDPKKKQEYIIEWMKEIENVILRSNRVQATRCMREQKFNVQTLSIIHLQQRNKHLLKTCKLSNKELKNSDTRMFFFAKERDKEKWE